MGVESGDNGKNGREADGRDEKRLFMAVHSLYSLATEKLEFEKKLEDWEKAKLLYQVVMPRIWRFGAWMSSSGALAYSQGNLSDALLGKTSADRKPKWMEVKHHATGLVGMGITHKVALSSLKENLMNYLSLLHDEKHTVEERMFEVQYHTIKMVIDRWDNQDMEVYE